MLLYLNSRNPIVSFDRHAMQKYIGGVIVVGFSLLFPKAHLVGIGCL